MKVEGTEKFLQAAHALNEAGDKELRKAVYRGFRDAAKPLGERMVRAGAAAMPKRGGLSARVAGSKIGIRNATTGRNPKVEIQLKTAQGYDLKGMDRGEVRHPVFARAGRKRVWARAPQRVPVGSFTAAFEEGAPGVRERIVRELQSVFDETARRA
ncbi:MAG: hypothetical protein ACXVGQ_00365 [Mycobacteriaceae bacterium]